MVNLPLRLMALALSFFVAVPFSSSLGQVARRHGPSEAVDHFEIMSLPAEGDASTEASLRALLQEGHHILEGEHSEAYLKRWAEKFNFKKVILNSLRWYQAHHSDARLKDHVANLILLLGTSHSLETVGGLALSTYGLSVHTGVARIILTTVGLGITIPGLDPLCIVLAGAYSRWPTRFDAFLSRPRWLIFKASDVLGRTLGVQAAFDWLFEYQTGADKLREKILRAPDGIYRYHRDSARIEIHFRDPKGEVLGMTRLQQLPGERLGLAVIELEPAALVPEARPRLRQLLKPFGWNIREQVLEVQALALRRASDMTELSHRPFIRSVVARDGGTLRVELLPQAYPIGGRYKIRRGTPAGLRCEGMHGSGIF